MGTNDSVPTEQLRSLGVLLYIIGCGAWNFRVMNVSRVILKAKHLEGNIRVSPLLLAGENTDTRRNLIKSLYVHSEDCKEWYITLRDFLVGPYGGWGGWLRLISQFPDGVRRTFSISI